MRFKTGLIAVCGVFLVGVSAPAGTASSTNQVVKGRFSEFSAGIDRDFDIWGPVRLTIGEDWTSVRANAKGLEPSTTYTSHLHESACSDADGGGHYKNDPAGPPAPPNELWLMFHANSAGSAHDSSSAPWVVRDGARSVVIHDTDGARIACADLFVE